MNRRIFLAVTMFLIMVMVGAGCSTAKKPEPAPKSQPKTQSIAPATLFDAAGKDPSANGCVSCHKKEGDLDRSLPAYVKRIPGHPDVKESTVNACYVCHDPQKDFNLYKRFFRGIHKTHWGSDTFYGKFKGQCFSCHTVETNGVAGIKNYPAAGYRENVPGSTTGKSGAAPGQGTVTSNQETQTTEKTKSTKLPKGQTTVPQGSTNQSTESELPVPTP